MDQYRNNQKQTRLSKTLHLLFFLVSIVITLTIMFSTNPDTIGPIGIAVFFVFLLISAISFGYLMLDLVFNRKAATAKLVVVLMAMLLVGTVALNTVSFSVGDIILFALFIATFFLYWVRLRKS